MTVDVSKEPTTVFGVNNGAPSIERFSRCSRPQNVSTPPVCPIRKYFEYAASGGHPPRIIYSVQSSSPFQRPVQTKPQSFSKRSKRGSIEVCLYAVQTRLYIDALCCTRQKSAMASPSARPRRSSSARVSWPSGRGRLLQLAAMCSLVETTATETAQLGLEKAVALVVRRAGAGGISWDAIVALLDQAHYGWGAQIRTVHSKENNVRSILSKATTKRQLRHIGPRTYAAVL